MQCKWKTCPHASEVSPVISSQRQMEQFGNSKRLLTYLGLFQSIINILAPMEQQDEIQDQVNQNYRIWKKNSPYLYDLVIAYELQNWWSLTAQWLPHCDVTEDRHIHRAILGTQADSTSPNHLMIVKVFMPFRREQDEKEQYGEINQETTRVQIQTKIVHDGDVNRARYCPQRYNLIATKTSSGPVLLFDYARRPSRPSKDECEPDLILTGHEKEGYGLAWNQQKNGLLLSGGYDGIAAVWDVEAATSLGSKLQPLYSGRYQSDIEDVQWHPYQGDIFSSVGSDQHHHLTDLRKGGRLLSHRCHNSTVYSINWSPFNQYLFLTSGEDKLVSLWDLRMTKRSIRDMRGHQQEVMKVQWCPHSDGIFASSGADRKIVIWDLSRGCGNEQIFVHAGHRAKITDFDWNLNQKLAILSTQEMNIFQVWQMNKSIYSLETQ